MCIESTAFCEEQEESQGGAIGIVLRLPWPTKRARISYAEAGWRGIRQIGRDARSLP